MAVTRDKGKTRLDFSEAMNERLLQGNQKMQTAPSLPQTEVPNKKDVEMPVEVVTEEPVKVEVTPSILIEEPVKKEKPTQATKPKAPKVETSLEKRLMQSRKNRGVQKSVYFDANIYAFIEQLSEKYNLKFSAVLNELLRDLIR